MRERGASDHERHNRAFWDADADAYQAAHTSQLDRGRVWGVWSIPEDRIDALGDVSGLDVLELGCGAAQWSIALAADGARVVGLDQSVAQLGHAKRHLARDPVRVPLLCSSAEMVPLRSGSFDLVFCDHGALSFCDAAHVVPECGRLLRTGGRLVFNHATLLHTLCYDEVADRQTDRLQRDYHGAGRFDWAGGTVDFHLTYGEWIRCFRRAGFVVDDLIELVPSPRASTTYDFVPRDWARRWPAEEIWVVRKVEDAAGVG